MERLDVDSSNIKSVGYDATTKVLEVEFKAGPIYRYADVPADAYESLMSAESKGAYFAMAIRASYKFEKAKE